MKLTFSWFNGISVFYPFLMGAVTLFFGIIVVVSMMGGALSVALGGLLFFFVGAYLTLARLLNHTEVQITPTELIISHGPLPWIGDTVIKIEDIRSISYKWGLTGPVSHVYKVSYLLSHGRRGGLFPGVPITNSAIAIRWGEQIIAALRPYKSLTLLEE